MSAPAKTLTGKVATLADEKSFIRRRNHAQIEAMTGLILQAVGYPTRRHRDFICALQSVNSGNDARIPYTPFRRAHLTIADLMMCDGSADTRRKVVYREIRTLRRFQNRTGILLFSVTSGSDEEATEYIDYLTPTADAAVQRMLCSPLWKTDKQAAKREAVEWAVAQLPRCEVVAEAQEAADGTPLADYQQQIERRLENRLEGLVSDIEEQAQEIARRGGDAEQWLGAMMRKLGRALDSMKKTAPARLDHAALRAVSDEERASSEGDGAVSGGNTTGDSSVRPPSDGAPAIEAQEGADSSVLPPCAEPGESAPFALDEPTLFSEPRPDVGAKPQTLLEAALSYARRGWPVFPLHHPDPHRGCSCMEAKACRSPGKHPRTRKGLKDATTDPAQIKRWWEMYPLANVGLVTGRKSGLVALDVDPRSGGDASLCELLEAHGELPDTLEAITGGGGSHIFFAHPGVSFKNSSSVLGEGLDVKTDGGYVVAAPSLHSSGRRYQWRSRRRPAHIPLWLLNLLTQQKAPAPARASAPRRAPTAPAVGSIIPYRSRNTQLFRLACALRGDGAGRDEIERAVFDAYRQRCVKEPEPMSDSELRKIVGSALRYPAGSKRAQAHSPSTTNPLT